MGWADCGTDSRGRPIGYAFEATCDHPGCSVKIDRGISFACGGMHGESHVPNDGMYCENYYCERHVNDHYCDALDRQRDLNDLGYLGR